MTFSQFMTLKILLPYKVFEEKNDVLKITAQTPQGLYGFLPNRLDCAAEIKPGIFMYETEKEGKVFVALDEGILIKTDNIVTVSVRNAVGGKELGKIQEGVLEELLHIDSKEKNVRVLLSKLERSFIRQFEEFKK